MYSYNIYIYIYMIFQYINIIYIYIVDHTGLILHTSYAISTACLRRLRRYITTAPVCDINTSHTAHHTEEPLNGEHLHKAIFLENISKLEDILENGFSHAHECGCVCALVNIFIFKLLP